MIPKDPMILLSYVNIPASGLLRFSGSTVHLPRTEQGISVG